jgi:transposase
VPSTLQGKGAWHGPRQAKRLALGDVPHRAEGIYGGSFDRPKRTVTSPSGDEAGRSSGTSKDAASSNWRSKQVSPAARSIDGYNSGMRLQGVDGLRTGTAPGPASKLTEIQQDELVAWIEAGPQAAGYSSGVWTGPMIRDFIEVHFGVKYHNHHVPRMLNQLGFSIQRPRKRLARADLEAQTTWIRKTFPAIKKKPRPVAGS